MPLNVNNLHATTTRGRRNARFMVQSLVSLARKPLTKDKMCDDWIKFLLFRNLATNESSALIFKDEIRVVIN